MDLKTFFQTYPKVAVAFSGGVDSAYLLYEAKLYAENVKGYFVKSEFQPQFELDDALKIASFANVEMEVIPLSILSSEKVVENPQNRCYYCKKEIFSHILSHAKRDGFTVILDGTNASDDVNNRPGFKALQEMQVLSPLRLSGLTKNEVRKRSKEVGLETWKKPSYACLATRIPTGTRIEKDYLTTTERSEAFLSSLGFSDFRIRYRNGSALIQLREEQLLLFEENKTLIEKTLTQWYKSIILDKETRK